VIGKASSATIYECDALLRKMSADGEAAAAAHP
jgi:hypothetical protein